MGGGGVGGEVGAYALGGAGHEKKRRGVWIE